MAVEKPTRNRVDALAEKGLTVKQIAGLYGCSANKIAAMKSRKMQGWRVDSEYRDPISPAELAAARRVKIGTVVTVQNFRKDEEHRIVREEHRIVKKFPHIALLDNGMSVDYAEIAMQMRRR